MFAVRNCEALVVVWLLFDLACYYRSTGSFAAFIAVLSHESIILFLVARRVPVRISMSVSTENGKDGSTYFVSFVCV